MEKKIPVPIDSVIPSVLENCRPLSQGKAATIFERWNEVVGEVVAENAQPAAFNGNILLVHVSSSAWIQQLQFIKQDILSKINSELDGTVIDEIKFKIGPL